MRMPNGFLWILPSRVVLAVSETVFRHSFFDAGASDNPLLRQQAPYPVEFRSDCNVYNPNTILAIVAIF